jgi:hypothetical protein
VDRFDSFARGDRSRDCTNCASRAQDVS